MQDKLSALMMTTLQLVKKYNSYSVLGLNQFKMQIHHETIPCDWFTDVSIYTLGILW